jgi:hypothetical protein
MEINGLTSQPGHRHLEAHPGTGGGLAEDQAKNPVSQINAASTALQLTSQIQEPLGLLSGTVR